MDTIHLNRSLAVLPMGTVMKLTSLSSRQIRYYDDQGLVHSQKTAGNRRLYSLDNVDTIMSVHEYLSEGMTIADVKRVFQKQKARETERQQAISDRKAREYLRNDILNAGGFNESIFNEGLPDGKE